MIFSPIDVCKRSLPVVVGIYCNVVEREDAGLTG